MDPMQLNQQSAADLEWPTLLERLAQRCHSELAAARARSLDLLSDGAAIEEQLDTVREAVGLRRDGQIPPFGELFDLEPALKRLEKDGVLEAAGLIRIANTLRGLAGLARFLRGRHAIAPRLAEIAGRIDDLEMVWGAIADCFDSDGLLSDNASAELGPLRRRASSLRERISHDIKRLMDKPEIAKHLQDRFYTQRESRFVLPVRTDAGPAVEGIVLGSSSSGATMFVEPKQIVALNNQLKVAQLEVEREELRILLSLSELVADEVPTIRENIATGIELDLLDAKARLAVDMNAERPSLSQDGELRLVAARHPLLVLSLDEVVASDLELERGAGLVISGPNAGGKTVSLKCVGLCALMVRAGMLIPAESESRIPIYEHVLADIGDAQSISMNLSTFTAHLAQLLRFLHVANDRTLLLVDEIITGTDPGQGEALARALLEAFVQRCAQLIVTTHYERLKALPLADERFVNANVGFDLSSMRPTYRLHIGAPGTSFALAVARRLGLAESIAIRAETLLNPQENELSRLLVQLADERTRLEQAKDKAQLAQLAAERKQRDLDQRLEQIEEKEQRKIAAAYQEALSDLKGVRVELGRLKSEIRSQKSLEKQQQKQLDAEISVAAQRLAQHEPPAPAPQKGEPVAANEIAVGERYLAPSLGGVAEVVELLRRGKVMVKRGQIRSIISTSELQKPQSASRASPQPTSKTKKQFTQSASKKGRCVDNTLDLRGFRVDDALRETDAFADKALLAGQDILYILHGFGSGALRSALRDHLKHAPYVASFQGAEQDEGGEAVTVVELR
jgi:DNA mismatch repair protein MutS2